MNKIFVLFRDVPYEFGVVEGIYSTLPEALSAGEKIVSRSHCIEVQEWTLSSDGYEHSITHGVDEYCKNKI